MRKSKRNFQSLDRMTGVTIGSLIGGFSAGFLAWKFKTNRQKQKRRQEAEMENMLHRDLIENLPELLAVVGTFTDEEAMRYTNLLDRTQDIYGAELIHHVHTALNSKSMGYAVDLTEETIRSYFQALQILCECNMEEKWMTEERSIPPSTGAGK